MTKPGFFADPQPSGETRALGTELRRLRRAGLADLAIRPHRYPTLTRLFAGMCPHAPADVLERLHRNARLFAEAVASLPSDQLRQAAARSSSSSRA